MKKILTIALCVAAIGSAGAQKATVDAAKKAAKEGNLALARELFNQAANNPETKNAATYFEAGKAEFDAFDKAKTLKMLNPNDPSATPEAMGDELVNGYNFFILALPLDSLPNEKGQIKPKYSKDIAKILKAHQDDYFNAGAEFFNVKKYYPEAYNAFMTYGDMSNLGLIDAKPEDASQFATAYFNAGLAAYSGDKLDESAAAFKKGRLMGYEEPECYIYEIACWQNIAQRDDSRMKEAQNKIMDVATAGNEKFGLAQPIFLNNMINSLVSDNNIDGALSQLNNIISSNQDNANLYGLRGYVYDRAGNDDNSEADYRKAVSLPDVDFETLKNAGKKIYNIGVMKLNQIEGRSADDIANRNAIKANYFDAAMKIAEQAGAMNPNDPDLLNLIDNIDYAVTTYF